MISECGLKCFVNLDKSRYCLYIVLYQVMKPNNNKYFVVVEQKISQKKNFMHFFFFKLPISERVIVVEHQVS